MKKLLFLSLLFIYSLSSFADEKEYNIIVDRNGTGHFRNVQQAIDSVRAFNPAGWVTIYIKNGYYKEKIELYSYLTNVKLVGESSENTIINYDDHANINKMGTFRTYTFLVRGNNITFENLTIENSAAQLGQAVALHIEGDRIIFRNCRILGNQDTIYLGREGGRAYFENCYIDGTTDYIFGPATAWFEKCTLVSKRNSYITAANTPENQKYGLIFNNCTIEAATGITSIYLGRPWRAYSMTLFMNSNFPKEINPKAWDNWRNPDNEKTARYMEYNNKGEGANRSKRVAWAKDLSEKEAKEYTLENVLTGSDNWNPLLVK